MSDDDEIAVGIDLGTTNSVLAYLDPHGRPMSIANSEGDLLTPSVIYFEPQADPIVGKEAVKAGTLDPEHTVEAVKRDMGRDIYPRAIRGKYYSPAALSGIILKRLVEDARARAGNVTRAVITVPAYFNEPRRKATVDAAMHAGLTEVELINEPTSARCHSVFNWECSTKPASLRRRTLKFRDSLLFSFTTWVAERLTSRC